MCDAGMGELASMISQFGYRYQSTYGAVGVSTIAATASDTQLGSEIARSPVQSPAVASDAWTWQFYFKPATATTEIYECGVFLAATATTGFLLDHLVQTTPLVVWQKNETLLLQATFEMSNG